jgi:hypothetical protein
MEEGLVTFAELRRAGVSEGAMEQLTTSLMLGLAQTQDKTAFKMPGALAIFCPPLNDVRDLELVFAILVGWATNQGGMSLAKAAEVRKEGGKKTYSSPLCCGLTLLSFTQTFFAKSIMNRIAQLQGQQVMPQQQQQPFSPSPGGPSLRAEIPTSKSAPPAVSGAPVVSVKEEGEAATEKKNMLNQRVSLICSFYAAAAAASSLQRVVAPYGRAEAHEAFELHDVKTYFAHCHAVLFGDRLQPGSVPSLCTIRGCKESLSGTNSTTVHAHLGGTAHKTTEGVNWFVSGWDKLQLLKDNKRLFPKGAKSFPSFRGVTESFLLGLKTNLADAALTTLTANDEEKQLACFACNFVAAMNILFPQACAKVFGKGSGPKEPKSNKKPKLVAPTQPGVPPPAAAPASSAPSVAPASSPPPPAAAVQAVEASEPKEKKPKTNNKTPTKQAATPQKASIASPARRNPRRTSTGGSGSRK